MSIPLRTALAVAGLALATQAAADITLYGQPGFGGRAFTTTKPIGNLERFGFNDRASSAVVTGERWEVCDDAGFAGRCVVLRPGQYGDLAAMGLSNSISSVRIVGRGARIEESRFGPPPVVDRDYRRRPQERLYEADVVMVRAVVGPPERRCWVEREQLSSGSANVPGALAGAVIGGILGHQIGSGRGNDAATAGGAIAGAAIGSNVGRDDRRGFVTQDVQRCSDVQSATPAYYDVTYNFRGRDYRMQTTTPPGRTILVNAQGEPRV